MPSNTYDLIVLGDDLAGLIAATLVARSGQRVLIVVSGSPDSYRLGPYTLPARPLSLAGRTGAPMRRVLDDLHFSHPINRKLGSSRPAFQFAMPRARLDVFADEVALATGLDRESEAGPSMLEAATRAQALSAELDALLAKDAMIPPSGFFEKRARRHEELAGASEWWASVSADSFGRALFAAPAALTGGLASDSLTAVARLRAFDSWRHGAPRLLGDWRTLKDLFLDKFDSHGGDVKIGYPEELTFGWGSKVTGVKLEDGDDLGAGHVLAAMPIAELEAIAGKQTKKLHGFEEQIELAGYRYVLNLVVDEIGVPEGMAHTVLYVGDPDKPLTGANAMLVHVAEPDNEAKVAITATANCMMESERTVEQTFADLRVQMRETLEDIMPFVTDHVLLAHSPHERLPAEGLEGEYELDEPIEPQPIWSPLGNSYLGISGLPYQLGLKNLTLCSSQILPGLGLEGQFAVGWQAARLALSAAGKKKDFGGRSVLAGGD